jgi:hypothetical protein
MCLSRRATSAISRDSFGVFAPTFVCACARPSNNQYVFAVPLPSTSRTCFGISSRWALSTYVQVFSHSMTWASESIVIIGVSPGGSISGQSSTSARPASIRVPP